MHVVVTLARRSRKWLARCLGCAMLLGVGCGRIGFAPLSDAPRTDAGSGGAAASGAPESTPYRGPVAEAAADAGSADTTRPTEPDSPDAGAPNDSSPSAASEAGTGSTDLAGAGAVGTGGVSGAPTASGGGAGSSSASDASIPSAGSASSSAAARSCAQGSELGGHCWFLGALGSSCDEACQSHGGYEPSLEWIGSPAQGGSLARCDQLLTLLTAAGTTTQGTRTDGRGLGCHLYLTQRWWLYAPDFDPSAKLSSARIVCSCVDP